MIKQWIKRTTPLIFTLLGLVIITACGGGGGGSDSASKTGSGFVPPPVKAPQGANINITLTDIDSQSITEINPLIQGVIRMTVTDADDVPVTRAVISATTTLGRMVPETGTALTDDNGVAILYVMADGIDGAGTLTASLTFNEVESEGSINFSITTEVEQAARKIGYIDNAGAFVDGVIQVDPSGQVSAGGTAALTVVVVDDNNDPVTTEERVTFSSNCLFGNQAVLDPPSPVSLGSKITVNFTINGCQGEEIVTAKLASSGAEAQGTVSIAPVQGQLIRFDEQQTNSTLIAIRGTGSASDLSESADVFFRVTDAALNPVADARINLSLLQSVGNSALACAGKAFCDYRNIEDERAERSRQDTQRSDVNGYISARVLSGSVASTIQILAYLDLNENGEREDNETSTVSKVLIVSTGVADQDSISLSAKLLNPYGSRAVEYEGGANCNSLGTKNDAFYTGGLEADGLCTDVMIKLADRFNNPVPDGTAATLTTEFGRIQGSCITQGGDCSVSWTSQNPRASATVEQYSAPITINENLDPTTPSRYACPSHKVNYGPCPDDIASPTVNPPGAPRGGRSTVTLTVTGEESFVDRNGNGYYDEGELWTNLTEAFTDHNEDGVYTPQQRDNCLDPRAADDICLAGFEEGYYDFNNNGQFDRNDTPKATPDSALPDGLFNGVLCRVEDEAAGICSRDLVQLSQNLELILSPGEKGYDFLVVDRNQREADRALYGGNTYQLYVADLYNNPPPGLTNITITGGGGCSVINAVTTVPLPSSNIAGAYRMSFAIAADIESERSESDPDRVEIALTLPSGNGTRRTYNCPVSRQCDPEDLSAGFSPNCG
ncbi:hypothetical protein N9Y37_11280 [Luminiphilus sp.]|nr:hypothetical protein [Luminiphilus sp.]